MAHFIVRPPLHRLKACATAIVLGVFALDRFTKWIIETRVSAFDTHIVIPGFFNIIHSRNSGVAFSLFADSTSPFRTLVVIGLALAALVLLGSLLWKTSHLDRMTFWGLSLVFGGAMGNVFDRIVWGTVTDFLDFYIGTAHWPTFNVADSAIVVGSALLLLDMLKPKRQPAGV